MGHWDTRQTKKTLTNKLPVMPFMGMDQPKMSFQKYIVSVIYIIIGTLGQRGLVEFLQFVFLDPWRPGGPNQIY